MRSFSYSEKLKKILKKLYKKDKVHYEAIMGKINEIVNSYDIEHYKNLKYDLSDIEIPSNSVTLQSGISNRHSRTKGDTINGNVYKKRVHVMGSFVLIFIYNKKNNAILFEDYDHHDEFYRR